ncbi:unnamed protein product [Closterium sp. NIES-53]
MLRHIYLTAAGQRDYELHSLDFSTAFLQGSLHEKIWLRRPPGFTGLFPTGTWWSLRRPVYGLRLAPRDWHDTLRTTLVALVFAPSSADPSLFLRTDTTLPPFYILVSFSASASSTTRHSQLLCLLATRSQIHLRMGPTSGMGLVLGGQGSVVLTRHSDASWADDQATQRSCEAEIYAGAMAAQELRWLTDLGERHPVLYVDNKAILAFCHEQRLEHRTKHIALRYFLARELQQRSQLRLFYVASRANTAYVFTKALASGDHQRFCTALGLLPVLPHLLVALLVLYCDLYI